LRLRTLSIAVRLFFSGDFSELLRRVRVRVFGKRSIALPTCFELGSTSGVSEVELIGAAQATAFADTGMPTEPVRCLMFAHNLNYEGAPKSQLELTRVLMERKVIAPEVIAFDDGPLRAAYETSGIAVTIIPNCLHRMPTLARLEKVVDELVKIISDKGASVVYANTLLTFPAVLAADKAGVPSIWNPRESEPWETYFGFLSDAVAQRALAAFVLPYRVVFVADATRRAWSTFDVRRNFTVIRNGLDTRSLVSTISSKNREKAREKLGYAEQDIVFLCVGMFCERKGQRDLVQALGGMEHALVEHAHLCLVGDENAGYGTLLRSDIKKLSSEMRAHVALHSATPEVHAYYAAADVFVLCSRVESYPRVILEALFYGLPVIATPVFGVLEQVSNGVNAMFFQPGDTNELASHMGLLIKDPQLRERLADGSKSGFNELTTFDEMVEAYGDVFRGASRIGAGRH
jgi:glycosyltransferase involved in cell wall biosynthesis